tara:strand:- start:861 stop:1259 length:399 start_codon:yes stop_codon:yes gene_type:complete
VPTVTYIGSRVYRKKPDGTGELWPRGEPVEVSQAYLDEHRVAICTNPTAFLVEGDEGVTVDEGSDGLPDAGWTKKDITAWLVERGQTVGGYATKSKLLDAVEGVLNPAPAPEPEAEVEEAPEEPETEEGVEA